MKKDASQSELKPETIQSVESKVLARLNQQLNFLAGFKNHDV